MWLKLVVDRIASVAQWLEERLARDAVLLDVERSIQTDGYSCGAQSAFVILRHFSRARSIAAVTRAAKTDEDGTSTRALLALFRKRGLKPVINARATVRDLRRAIDGGAPALVSMDDECHWAVVYGHSCGRVFVADPSIRKTLRVGLSVEAFRARWDRWAMIVRPR